MKTRRRKYGTTFKVKVSFKYPVFEPPVLGALSRGCKSYGRVETYPNSVSTKISIEIKIRFGLFFVC